MKDSLEKMRPAGLERSCGPSRTDWIRRAPGDQSFERFEAFFAGHAYDPHRHDVYAIGYTVSGVQSFDYRGMQADSRAGNAIAIHPDETHDGHAGEATGFCYRMAYIEPRLIRDALGARARTLPFVRSPVTNDPRLLGALLPVLGDMSQPLEALERDQGLIGIAETLLALDGASGGSRPGSTCAVAVETARAFLDARFATIVDSDDLERICGLDRYTLARQFRQRLGTSPYRYLTMRRLDFARRLIRGGEPLAIAAAASGFADQSHMTRQFRRAYGLPPGRWQALQVD